MFYDSYLELLLCKAHSETSSGNSTPTSSSDSFTLVSSDARRYFEELCEHIKGIHGDKYRLTLTEKSCKLFEGRSKQLYATDGNVASVRNLYIMMAVCGYDVDDFLTRIQDEQFVNEERPKGKTLPRFSNFGFIHQSMDFLGKRLFNKT